MPRPSAHIFLGWGALLVLAVLHVVLLLALRGDELALGMLWVASAAAVLLGMALSLASRLPPRARLAAAVGALAVLSGQAVEGARRDGASALARVVLVAGGWVVLLGVALGHLRARIAR